MQESAESCPSFLRSFLIQDSETIGIPSRLPLTFRSRKNGKEFLY